MATKEPSYYLRWIKRTFDGPWGLSSLVGSILTLSVPLALRFIPALSSLANRINDLQWQVPLALFLLLTAVRFITVPRSLYLEDMTRAAAQELRIKDLSEKQRPFVIASMSEELIEDDPGADEPYLREVLRFTNIGAEAALAVSIGAVKLGSRDLTLWKPVDVIKSGEHEDRSPKGGLRAGLSRIRKQKEIKSTVEILLPLVVKYSDRHGNEWSTPHKVVSRGGDVHFEPIHSLSDVEWTEITSA